MPVLRKARNVVGALARGGRDIASAGDSCGADRGTQILLAHTWTGDPDRALRDVEFRNFSQNGEDGILLYLFTVAGHGHRRSVEVCAGVGYESNTANLVVHHAWDALMLDGNAEHVARGTRYFARHAETRRVGPTLATEWITVANVNKILRKYGYDQDVDLLSLDMDGIDYWILEAIELAPRVIVVEYNNRVPAHLAVTVPYSETFAVSGDAGQGEGYFGASLGAFDKLLRGRGYRLIGANRDNTNAFFARSDVLPERPPCSVESCLTSRWAVNQRTAHWPAIANRDWVTV